MSVVGLDRVPSRNPQAVYRIYDGQATIVLLDRSEVKLLNEIGSLVWEQIDGRRSVRDIVDVVLQSFEVSRDQAERDVQEFVGTLYDHGMVS